MTSAASTSSPPRSPLLRCLLLLLVFSPILYLGTLMKRDTVDVGCWDMWENAELMRKWHDGTLTWSDLYAPQIQHRIVVPRVLIITLTTLSGGDFRWECWFTWLIFAANSVMLWRLLGRGLGASPWRWPLMFAFNLLLACPIHYQILQWGSSMWAALPMSFVLGSLLVLTPRGEKARRPWVSFAAAVLLAELATHSFAHGIAIWPVMLGVLLFQPKLGPLRLRLIFAGLWVVIAGATLGFYFSSFVNQAHHAYNLKPGQDALDTGGRLMDPGHLGAALRFLFAFTGTWFARIPFEGHPLETAVTLGKWTCGTMAVLVIFTLRNRLLKSVLPWMAIAAYVLVVGLMLSKRASDIGEHRAITPRYMAVSQYLLMAGLAITATLGAVFRRAGERWKEKHPEEPSGAGGSTQALRTAGVVALAAFCTAQIPVWQYGHHLWRQWHLARRQAQALLLFLPHLESQRGLISLKTLDMEKSGWNVLDAVNTLQELNLLKTRPLKTPELQSFTHDKKDLPVEKADVTEARLLEDGTVELKGVARFNVGEPVDAILLVQQGRVVTLGQPAPKPLLRLYSLDYEFGNVDEVPVRDMYPWQVRMKLSAPDAPIELWALNVESRRVSKLKASLKVAPDGKGIEVVRE